MAINNLPGTQQRNRKKQSRTSQAHLMGLLEENRNPFINPDMSMMRNSDAGGTILEIRLVDFMSHKNFTFPKKGDSLKQISFICGKNGSGKSAILQAVKVIFGGQASGGKKSSGLY